MTEEKGFGELLDDSPLATNEGTVTLVGALQRSRESGKFVLSLGNGQNVTLDVAAVRGHKVLAGMAGQRLVQVELDQNKLPNDFPGMSATAFTSPEADYGVRPKFPPGDLPPVGTIMEHLPSAGGDPYFGAGFPAAGVPVPFVLATPHHVPTETAYRLFSRGQYPSIPWWSEHIKSVPELDYNRKVATDPSLDIQEGGTMLYYDYV